MKFENLVKNKIDNNEPQNNKEAERAIMGVMERLEHTLSVGSLINELINNATDPENLCLMYAGWAAWL